MIITRPRDFIVAILIFICMPFTANAQATARPGWIGVGYTFHEATEAGKSNWLYVQRLAPGSPAEKAGIRIGDIISAIEGKPLAFHNEAEALAFFRTIKPKTTVQFSIVRMSGLVRLRVTAIEIPDEYYGLWLENEKRLAASKRHP